jgi:hypothetical protein
MLIVSHSCIILSAPAIVVFFHLGADIFPSDLICARVFPVLIFWALEADHSSRNLDLSSLTVFPAL